MNGRNLLLAAGLVVGSASFAAAVSDGTYDPARQHCTGAVDNSDHPTNTEPHCHNFTLTVRDGDATNYHEYFGIGVQQEPDTGSHPLVDLGPAPFSLSKTKTVDIWYDPGPPSNCQIVSVTFDVSGADQCNLTPLNWLLGLSNGTPPSCSADPNQAMAPTVTPPAACNFLAGGSTAAPNPSSGLHLYLGADDNLDAGEHDSSDLINNGPSDGGAIQLNLTPQALSDWITRVGHGDIPGLLTHPLPLADAGMGSCADGFCVSVQTTRRDQAYSGGTSNDGSVANYEGRQWDPYNCSGPDDGTDGTPTDSPNPPGNSSPSDCGGYTIDHWNNGNGDPGMDPGVQIYEDPDAQGSPIGPLYPIPAIYVGTCGVIIGGGATCDDASPDNAFEFNGGNCSTTTPLPIPATPPAAPGAPYINDAGQLVIPTDCNGEQALP